MRAADAPPSPSPNRVSSIDGLRGFLAFGVFFYHVVITYQFLKTGVWAIPGSHFYRMLGPLAVGFFFMITGYLFWSKAMADGGQMNFAKLYIGRGFRIGPLYLFAIGIMLALVAYRTRLHLQERAATVVGEVAGWLALGLIYPHGVNGYGNTNQILAGVTWTLFYEWMFYFSLIVTSFAAVYRFRTVLVSLAYVCSLFATLVALRLDSESLTVPCSALFVAGMLCATLEKENLRLRAQPWVKSLLSLLLLAFALIVVPIPNSAASVFVAGLCFHLWVSGGTLFGLLTSRAAHRLGNISYGVYLLQGLVLTGASAIPFIRNFALQSPFHYWSFALACAIVLTAVATATHVWIERPGIDAGRYSMARLERWTQNRPWWH